MSDDTPEGELFFVTGCSGFVDYMDEYRDSDLVRPHPKPSPPVPAPTVRLLLS